MLYLQVRKSKPIKFYYQNTLFLSIRFNEFGPGKKWAKFIVDHIAFQNDANHSQSMTLLAGNNRILFFIKDELSIMLRYCHPINDGRGAKIKLGIEAESNIIIEYCNKQKD
jgi:hypothetical protein